jgi:hypothetical protein
MDSFHLHEDNAADQDFARLRANIRVLSVSVRAAHRPILVHCSQKWRWTMEKKQLPVGIERVRAQFESWRARKRKGERIPEPLWQAAAEAARKHGIYPVSHAVRLEYAHLKRRVSGAAPCRDGAGREAEFIELEECVPSEGVGCIVELEKGNGTRMRICVGDSAAVDWARMKEAFLGA